MTGPAFEYRYPAEARGLSAIRAEAATAAMALGLPDHRLADVRLAVSEAASNVVLHAYAHDATVKTIQVRIYDEGEGVTISIADTGRGIRPRLDSPGMGLGLPSVASVADRLEVVPHNPGTEIRIGFCKNS